MQCYASNISIIMCRDKVTLGAVLLYGLFSFAVIGFDECYSLWASTSKSLGMYNLYSYYMVGNFLGVQILWVLCMILLVHEKF